MNKVLALLIFVGALFSMGNHIAASSASSGDDIYGVPSEVLPKP